MVEALAWQKSEDHTLKFSSADGADRAQGLGFERLMEHADDAMKFLKTLSWVVVAVAIAIFIGRNWSDVTINLWGNIQADVKLPFLLLLIFLVGFLPPYLLMRSRVWNLKRKLALAERTAAPPPPAPSATAVLEAEGPAA